jgi:ribosomal protein L34E
MPICKKHPNTELVIRQGKRNQNFVVCPECRPELSAAKKTDPPATQPAEEKKNGKQPTETEPRRPWYDRPIL